MRREKRKLVICGVRLPVDRPEACYRCRFWKNQKVGCIKESGDCPYLLREIDKYKKCEGCPYAKGRPCTSAACYKDLVFEMKQRRKAG